MDLGFCILIICGGKFW